MSRDDDYHKRHHAGAWGQNADEALLNLRLSELVRRFRRTSDHETLAQLVELDPPAGNSDIGAAIASALRGKQHQDQKAQRDELWRLIDITHRALCQTGLNKSEAYKIIADSPDFFDSNKKEEAISIESIRIRHERWIKNAEQNL